MSRCRSGSESERFCAAVAAKSSSWISSREESDEEIGKGIVSRSHMGRRAAGSRITLRVRSVPQPGALFVTVTCRFRNPDNFSL